MMKKCYYILTKASVRKLVELLGDDGYPYQNSIDVSVENFCDGVIDEGGVIISVSSPAVSHSTFLDPCDDFSIIIVESVTITYLQEVAE